VKAAKGGGDGGSGEARRAVVEEVVGGRRGCLFVGAAFIQRVHSGHDARSVGEDPGEGGSIWREGYEGDAQLLEGALDEGNFVAAAVGVFAEHGGKFLLEGGRVDEEIDEVGAFGAELLMARAILGPGGTGELQVVDAEFSGHKWKYPSKKGPILARYLPQPPPAEYNRSCETAAPPTSLYLALGRGYAALLDLEARPDDDDDGALAYGQAGRPL
jgi:hypothetical protein